MPDPTPHSPPSPSLTPPSVPGSPPDRSNESASSDYSNKPNKKPFKSNRGRPRREAPRGPDLGTPELILKRAQGDTAESIDLCLERRLISDEQHGCALHLRWLHTIRYGAPGITALDLSRGPGQEIPVEDDPRWRMHRERDYHEAVELLKECGYAQELLPCIIYDERPGFLNHHLRHAAFNAPAIADRLQREAARFAEGLELLVEHWGRRL